MDRNICPTRLRPTVATSLSARRAWIEIFAVISLIYQQAKSLSARRAWIEIVGSGIVGNTDVVALRKESVDRNHAIRANHHKRRVALRKESVDRNRGLSWWMTLTLRRSPQGERG